MRHLLARILNCAAPLVAALPAIFLLPSGWSDFATNRVPSDSIPAQRNDIFSLGAEAKRAPSIALDLIVDRASMSFGAEPVEVASSSPGSHFEAQASTVAFSNPERRPEGAPGESSNPQECVSTELTTDSNLGQFSNPTCGGARRTLAEIAEARAYLLENGEPRIHYDAARPGSRD
jgi:hypothetical protein